MAQFSADIALKLNFTAEERGIKKVERSLSKVEQASNDILTVDKKIISARKQLLTLSADQAGKTKKRLTDLRLQRAELSLQKRELQGIARLERSRSQSSGGSSASNSGGDGAGVSAGLFAGLAFSGGLSKEIALSTRLTKELKQASDKVDDSIERSAESQAELNAQKKRLPNLEGQVTRITNQNNKSRAAGRKLTEAQVKSLIDAKEEVKKLQREIKGLETGTSRLGNETDDYVKSLEKANSIQQKQAKRVARQKKVAGAGKAALAGAAFSSVPGQDLLAAGAAGALVGGPAGAGIAAGVAGILKLTSALAGLAAPTARAAADLEKLQIALRGVVGTDYGDALIAIESASQDFNQTLSDTTKQFTQLSAAGVANGKTVREVENLYRGLAAATKATGGSADDLNGVLRAATQVLSKNKVQAEELRGQIGDRLPGAFALFAEATGRTSQELDKALKDGLVSADEFVTDFGNFIREKYEPAAFLISQSPAEAGNRLKKQLTQLQRDIGPLLKAIGSEFQIFATEALKSLDPLFKGLNKFFQLDRSGKNTRLADLEKNKIPEIRNLINELAGKQGDKFIGIPKIVAGIFDNPGALRSVDYVFKQAGKKLVEFEARALQLRNELFPPNRPQTVLEDPLSEDPEDPKNNIKTLLGIDWAKLIGLKESELQLKITEAQGQALLDGNKALFDRLEISKQDVRIQLEIEELTKGIAQAEERVVKFAKDEVLLAQAQEQLQDLKNGKLERELQLRNTLATRGNQAFKDDIDAAIAFGQVVQNIEPLEKKLSDTETLLNDIGGRITTGLVDGLALAVSGTEKLGEAFQELASDILEAIGKALILNAITTGISALGGNDGVGLFSMLGRALGKREFGGPVSAGTPYLVGEAGPELVIPGQSGTVLNNRETQNVMSRYSPATGGGNAGPMSVNYSGPVLNFNQQDYVPASAVPEIINAAAKKGAAGGNARTMNNLRNSRSQRNRIGLR